MRREGIWACQRRRWVKRRDATERAQAAHSAKPESFAVYMVWTWPSGRQGHAPWAMTFPPWFVEEDRKERRRKLGLPEELSEEEKAAERARIAEAAKAKPSIGLPVKQVSLLAQMREVLVRPL